MQRWGHTTMGNYVNSFKKATDLESVKISKMMFPNIIPILALKKNLVPYILKFSKPTVYVYPLFLRGCELTICFATSCAWARGLSLLIKHTRVLGVSDALSPLCLHLSHLLYMWEWWWSVLWIKWFFRHRKRQLHIKSACFKFVIDTLSETSKYGKQKTVCQNIFEHVSTCFLKEKPSHSLYYMLSFDMPFFRSTFTVQRRWREPNLLKESRTMQLWNKL